MSRTSLRRCCPSLVSAFRAATGSAQSLRPARPRSHRPPLRPRSRCRRPTTTNGSPVSPRTCQPSPSTLPRRVRRHRPIRRRRQRRLIDRHPGTMVQPPRPRPLRRRQRRLTHRHHRTIRPQRRTLHHQHRLKTRRRPRQPRMHRRRRRVGRRSHRREGHRPHRREGHRRPGHPQIHRRRRRVGLRRHGRGGRRPHRREGHRRPRQPRIHGRRVGLRRRRRVGGRRRHPMGGRRRLLVGDPDGTRDLGGNPLSRASGRESSRQLRQIPPRSWDSRDQSPVAPSIAWRRRSA
jgi:hypothetical protein